MDNRRVHPDFQTGRRVLALDFDGVVCDSIDECVLVSWNSHFRLDVDEFSESGLSAIPRRYVDLFLQSRGYARHLGHFLMPLLGGTEQFTSQEEFDRCYRALPERLIDDFIQQAEIYRAAARVRHPERWLGLHRLYPGVADALIVRTAYFVTARDRASVVEVLTANGIEIDPSMIFGGRRDKGDALQQIADRENIAKADLWFVDDNLTNVATAIRSGFSGLWAEWGFNAPQHAEQARDLGVDSIALAEFPRLLAQAGGNRTGGPETPDSGAARIRIA